MQIVHTRDGRFRGGLAVAGLGLAFLIFSSTYSVAQESDPADEAVALFNKGQDAHEKGDLPGAIELYERALKLVPEFPEAEAQKAAAFVSLGRLEEAERAFRRAVKLRPDWSLAVAGLGDVLVQEQKYAEAGPVLKKAIELDGMSFPAYSALVELQLRSGASPEQLKGLLSSIDGLTGNARPTASIWAAKAALQIALGEMTEARKSLSAALKIDSNNRLALSQSIELSIAEKDAAAARGLLSRLESVSKNPASLAVYRAKVLILEDKVREAEQILSEIKEPDAETLRLRQTIRLNTTTDIGELEKELAAEPKNARLLGRLCSAFRTKDPLVAVDYCRRALEQEPTNLGYAIGYGASLLQARKYPEAVDVLSRLKTAAPDNETVRANLATAYFQLKRFAEAKAEYEWLVARQPKLAVVYYFLGIAHDQLGEYMDAMANYQQFLRLADSEANKLEIEKVNLRLPAVQKQIKNGRGRKND
jgi:tetratricopeptide (TPR) repeat protein